MEKNAKRVFVSDADQYSSRYIAKFLSTCLETYEDGPSNSTVRHLAYQIVGTVSSSYKDERSSVLLEKYVSPSKDELLQYLLECDVIVFNLSENVAQQQVEEATWAITALHAELGKFKSQKIFILVSTVMTRATAKSLNIDESGILLREEDFRRRRPHPNFRNHNNLEKLVLKLGRGKKSKLTSYVVVCGLQYGKGENLFHYFFKVSWMMQLPKVPIFGQGTNHIPMIHVYDLAGVIQSIIEFRPASKYILAVDHSKNTLEDIVKMISNKLGPKKIVKLPEDDAITMNAFQPEELECLKLDLWLDAFVIRDSLCLHWMYEAGIIVSMDRIVQEYKDTRQLLPIRICVIGPPAVGKTTVAKKLCSHYKINHISIKEIIEEKITELKGILEGSDPEYSSEDLRDEAETQLQSITRSMKLNAGRLADHLMFDILLEKLNSNPCRNQGFVLDDYPKTYEQAYLLFMTEDTEDHDSNAKKPEYNEKITPDHVFTLEATDDFLTKRVQELSGSVAEKMRFTQDAFAPRLSRHRRRAAAEETVLDYFDQLEVHPEHIEVTTDDPEYTDVMRKITEMVGLPKNYGKTPEEQEVEDKRQEAKRKQKLAAEAAELKIKNEAALAEMAAQHEEWGKNLSEVTRQERELLEAQALPLRNYLMAYVMPSLTEAMLDCCKIKPEDPVDFLAERLLRNKRDQTSE